MPTAREIKEALKDYTVGIAGVGGLGSNVAMLLTRVGVGHLVIADYDTVTDDNLSRQYFFWHQVGWSKIRALRENLPAINPMVDVTGYELKVDEDSALGVFDGVDVLVEAFDDARMKKVLIEVFQLNRPDIPIVAGNGIAGWGKSNDMRVVQYGNIYLCGDGVSEVSDDLPPLGPRVSICASMQANVVVSILLGRFFGVEFKP